MPSERGGPRRTSRNAVTSYADVIEEVAELRAQAAHGNLCLGERLPDEVLLNDLSCPGSCVHL